MMTTDQINNSETVSEIKSVAIPEIAMVIEPELQERAELSMHTLDQVALRRLNYSYAKKHSVLVRESKSTSESTCNPITIIHTDHLPSLTQLELRRFLKRPFRLELVSVEEFNTELTQVYEAGSNAAMQMAEGIGEELDLAHLIQGLPKSEDLLESHDDAPIIRLLNAILTQAIKLKASDIHIETFEEKLIVRFRIDGILQEQLAIQRILAPLIISRVKVMAKLDIAEKRLPQDGRITLRIAGHTVDVRVSTLPSNHGERVVLRLLDKKVARLDLTLLGMSSQDLLKTEKIITRPNGILLVTGPTGSGKSTTLYAMLTKLNQVTRNILTVEDPIEYDLPGIGQTQVNTKVDMTFAKGLRAILRQDPDVVMVGEIRDLETVQIAVQASLTGHLVLSTLHTNSAIGAITRLRDMGVEPFLLSSTLIAVIAQRLVRVLCPHCKKAQPMTATEQSLLKITSLHDVTIYHPSGCSECNHTGYLGRTGIYEFVTIDERLQTMIHENCSEQIMGNYVESQTPSIRQDGFRRVLAGETSIEEVIRVANEI